MESCAIYTSKHWLWSHIGILAVKLLTWVDLSLLNTTTGWNTSGTSGSTEAYTDLAYKLTSDSKNNGLIPIITTRICYHQNMLKLALSYMSLQLKSCRGALLGLVLKLESSYLSFQGMFSLSELHIVSTVWAPSSPTWGFVSVLYTHCLQSHRVTSSASS